MNIKKGLVIGIISVLLLTGCAGKKSSVEEQGINTEVSPESYSEYISTISGASYDDFIKVITDNNITIDTTVELSSTLSKSGAQSLETSAIKVHNDGSSYDILYNIPKKGDKFSLSVEDLWKTLDVIGSDNKYKTQQGYYYEFASESGEGFYDTRLIGNNLVAVSGDLSCREEAYSVMNQLYDWANPEDIRVEE